MCLFCTNYCRFLLTSASLPPDVFIYRHANLLYMVFNLMFDKCLCIKGSVQKTVSKGAGVARKRLAMEMALGA